MKKLAIVLAIWLFLAPAAMFSLPNNNKLKVREVSNTTDFGLYGEFATFYTGKGNATALVLSSIGGSVEVPVNFSWEELDGLIALRIAGGVGHRWWLYYHHDIYPEIPPMITLIMLYDLPENQAVTKALSLAQKIGDAVNVSFYPLWSREEDGKTWILFTSTEASLDEIASFIKNKILSKFPNEGLSIIAGSPVIDENLNEGRYTRAALTLLRDIKDFDGDNDTEEFAPIVVLATVIKDAIQPLEDGWYKLSIKEALQLPDNVSISPRDISNASIIKISHYLPLEIDENRTSPLPDNPMYEYSGKLIYILKTENISREYPDIVVYGKPFDFAEELEQAPFVTAGFYISNITTINNWLGFGHDALNITYTVVIDNGGKGAAVNVKVGFKIEDRLKALLDATVDYYGNVIGYNDILSGPGWNYEPIEAEGAPIYAFTYNLDRVSANSTVALNFSLIVVPDAVGIHGIIEALNPHIGPIYLYEDIEGKKYFGFANGFSVVPDKAWAIGVLMIDSFEPINEQELYFRFGFKIALFGEGNTPLKNVVAKLYINKPEGLFSVSEIQQVDIEYMNQILPDENNSLSRNISLAFEEKLKSGVWFVFASVEFDVDTEWGTVHLGFVTNSYMIYVPPMPWLIQRWIQNHVFPYKHVELDVDKVAAYDNTTGELVIELNITNIGDTNTTIKLYEFLLLDYIDTSVGNNGIVEFKVNGESKLDEIEIRKKEDLGVLVIISPNITVDVNQTITVEIRVKIIANYTGEFVVRPTLIQYIFGDYAPDQIEKEEDQATECGSRSRGEAGSEYGERGEHEEGGRVRVLMEESFTVMQAGTANALSTYTNSVVLVVTPQAGRRFPWGLIILLTLIVSIIVVAYVVVSKRRS